MAFPGYCDQLEGGIKLPAYVAGALPVGCRDLSELNGSSKRPLARI